MSDDRSTRDFSTISPSARSLLVMRAATGLPFARAAAEVLIGAEALAEEEAKLAALPGTHLRRMHFEQRYRSIDALITQVGSTRIVEIGGGLSLRGLDWVTRERVTYVDTDLAEMVETKRRLVDALGGTRLGELRLEALDAMDGDAFAATIDTVPAGPIAIVNEGLLMYLDAAEKRTLAGHIRTALLARPGSVWITADIYRRVPHDPRIFRDEKLTAFLAQHRVEDNKFADFAEAEAFVAEVGLAIGQRAGSAHDGMRETWLLTAR